MPDHTIPASALASLNDKELEILRLLANRHTVKSIACRLERSETAVNERLREARRKTGVGSSRELARLLDTQKIWDKNIDLSKPVPADDILEQPKIKGLPLSKGTIASGRTLVAVCRAYPCRRTTTGSYHRFSRIA